MNNRRVPPTRIVQESPLEYHIPNGPIVQEGPNISEGFSPEGFSEIISKPGAIEEMMAHVQNNPQASSMIRDMISNPDAQREMTKIIQESGADIELMKKMNPRKNKHQNERPKMKEVKKMKKMNKKLTKPRTIPTMKGIKITMSRQVNPIDIPSENFPDSCLSKISTNAGDTLSFKEFKYGNDKYITVLYVEGDKRPNKLIRKTFSQELGKEVIIINGTVDQPSEMTPIMFKSLPALTKIEDS